MNCSRCQSLMIPDVPLQFYGSGDDLTERTFLPSYRCVCCGNVEDPMILLNRAKQAQERRVLHEATTTAVWGESLVAQAA